MHRRCVHDTHAHAHTHTHTHTHTYYLKYVIFIGVLIAKLMLLAVDLKPLRDLVTNLSLKILIIIKLLSVIFRETISGDCTYI